MMALGIVIHSQGRLIDTNSIFCEKSGYQLSELRDRNPLDLIAAESRVFVQEKIDAADEAPYLATGIKKDGTLVNVQIMGKTLTWEDIDLRIAVVREAAESEQRVTQEGLLRELAHSLRAPLSNLSLALQMMRLSPSEERQQQYYELAVRECDREIDLVNNFLNLSRVRSGSYPVNSVSINLNLRLPDLLQPFEMVARERGQRLALDLPTDFPPVISDPSILDRVLQELLTNACKYTAEGGEINLSACSTDHGVEFIVRNSTQIPDTELPRLFDSFYRSPRRTFSDPGGSGLGLTLVQEMVHLLQGEIRVTSQEGWTSFRLWLPLLMQEMTDSRK